ncbi:MAG: hypothetical protein HC869_17100 [Rhodospirillales bacterium]|nr:hypothetical protein [Rhodospirillales bacterium]
MSLSYDTDAALGHFARNIAERVAFNAMDIVTWMQSLVVPIPLIGDWLQGLSEPLAVKFGVPRPGAITFDGLTKIYPESFARGASMSGAIIWLAHEKILGDVVPTWPPCRPSFAEASSPVAA